MFGYGQYSSSTLNTILSTPAWVFVLLVLSCIWYSRFGKKRFEQKSILTCILSLKTWVVSFSPHSIPMWYDHQVVRCYKLYKTVVFADVDILIEENVFVTEISKTWRSKSILFAIIMEYKRIFNKQFRILAIMTRDVSIVIQACILRSNIIQTDTSKSLLMNEWTFKLGFIKNVWVNTRLYVQEKRWIIIE